MKQFQINRLDDSILCSDRGSSFHYDKLEHHLKKKSKEEFVELCNNYKIEIGKN